MKASGLASRRSHAPLPPIKVSGDAPRPEIHTSFDDSLLKIAEPSVSRAPADHSPVGIISSSRPATRPPSRSSPDSRRPSHARQMSTRSSSHRQRPPVVTQSEPRARVSPGDSGLVAPELKPKKSRSSLFTSLFSRPNAERARGHGGESTGEQQSRLRSLTRQASKRDLNSSTDSTSTTPAIRLSAPQQPSASSTTLPLPENVAPAPPTVNAPSRAVRPQAPAEIKPASWIAPPLAQAYAQAVKHATLEAPPSLHGSASKPRGHLDSIAEARDQSKSRPTTARANRPSTQRAEADHDAANTATLEQGGSKKIYVLVRAGYLLQYAGEGPADRCPEKILKLTKDSAAFASDLIPGKHWVLQIVQSSRTDPFKGASQKSLLQRWGVLPRRKDVTGLLLIQDSPESMDSWIGCIRAEIDRMRRIDFGRPLAPTRAVAAPDAALPVHPSQTETEHSAPILPKSPTLNVPSPTRSDPQTPTLDPDSEAATSQRATLSDLSPDSFVHPASLRRLSDLQRLSIQPSGPHGVDMALEQQMDLSPGTPYTEHTITPGGVSDSDDADFEYLFPAPGKGRVGSTASDTTSPSVTNYSPLTPDDQNRVDEPRTGSRIGACSEKRVSTYLSQSEHAPPDEGEGFAAGGPARTAKSNSPSIMERIDESAAFFSHRAPLSVEAGPQAASSYKRMSVPSGGPPAGNAHGLRATLSSDNLPRTSQASSAASPSDSSSARSGAFPARSSSRLSVLQAVPQDGAKRSVYRTALPSAGAAGPSPNAFALASVPENSLRETRETSRDSRRSSQRMSTLIHSHGPIPLQAGRDLGTADAASVLSDDSARSSRRTSVFTNGSSLPQYASSTASLSPVTSGYGSWNSSQRTSMRMSIVPSQARLSTVGKDESGGDAMAAGDGSNSSSSSSSSWRRTSRSPAASGAGAGKRESVMVPIIRPPSLPSRRAMNARASLSVGLPPPQPPPSVPLPMLPPGFARPSDPSPVSSLS